MTDITTKLRSALTESAFSGLAVVIAHADCKEAADEIDRLRAEVARLGAALDRLLCATEGHDVCPYAKAEARYVLTPEAK